MKYIVLCLMFVASAASMDAQYLQGKVTDENAVPLMYATVVWENDLTVGTMTDENGNFTIKRIPSDKTEHLKVSFVGYAPVLIPVEPNETTIEITISGINDLETVNISAKQRATSISILKPFNVETIGGTELRKAACCNLSESFETNASVDVSFSDAVTGVKEIEMLGLRGTYTQWLSENRPTFNGLASAYGLEFIPGSWLESIQVSKGAGSVINGPRSLTGSINFELQKPSSDEKLFVNLFASNQGRYEGNLHFNQKLTSRLFAGFLFHASMVSKAMDENGDTFNDNPTKKQLNGMFRMEYKSPKMESQFSIHALTDQKDGGQDHAHGEIHVADPWLFDISNQRAEVVWKIGYMGFVKPFKSLGFQTNATIHDFTANFGTNLNPAAFAVKDYSGLQKSLYFNTIYETILFNTFNKIRTGGSFQLDDFKEKFRGLNLNRTDIIPGGFVEYTRDFFGKKHKEHHHEEGEAEEEHSDEIPLVTMIAGFRADYLHHTGLIATPRITLKYNPTTNTVLRGSVGRGWRTANVLPENFGLMANAREWVIQDSLAPEKGWNYGLNFAYRFAIKEREGDLNIDLYRTHFENQVVVDVDSDYGKISVYNLVGKSFANNATVTWNQDIIKKLELRLAYRYTVAKTQFGSQLLQRALMPTHRALAGLTYTPKGGWMLNTTLQVVGNQRLTAVGASDLTGLPDYRLNKKSPVYALLNAQINKTFKKGFEVYLGAENITSYKQPNAILGVENVLENNPTTPRFDASQVYAPIMGITIYAGLRYSLRDGFNYKEVSIKTSAQCGMCKESIEKGLKNIPGVASVTVDLATKTAKIKYQKGKVGLFQLKQAISLLGYDADEVKRDPISYDNLHECCK